MMSRDHAALLARIATGDEDAMRILYDAYRLRLWRYLWSLLDGHADWVEETLQDVFVAIWRGAREYRGQARSATWIYHIARNKAITLWRERSRHPPHLGLPLDEREELREQPTPLWGSAISESVLLEQISLEDALEHLSPKHREVIELIFFHGLLQEDVATILGVPLGTVKSRLSYARQALLRDMIMENHHDR
jgi:RNA polymerase sigma-70 factor, ECF subfamily